MKKSTSINQLLFAMMSIALISFGCGANDEQDMDLDLDKDDNASGYFLKAKVDGKLVEFKTETLLDGGMSSTIPGVYVLSLSGAREISGQAALAESITIVLTETSPITQKSYSGYAPFENGFKGVLLGYALDVEDKIYTTDITNVESVLEITEIKASFIKGKFNGVVKDFLSGDTKTISEGEFFVKRSN
ncbi:MAG: hypothetical protein ACFCUU_15960 [Cyclobacteriaceae bacterium]